MAALAQEPQVLAQALEPASDIVMWQHISDAKLSDRQHQFFFVQEVSTAHQKVHHIGVALLRLHWASTASIVKPGSAEWPPPTISRLKLCLCACRRTHDVGPDALLPVLL